MSCYEIIVVWGKSGWPSPGLGAAGTLLHLQGYFRLQAARISRTFFLHAPVYNGCADFQNCSGCLRAPDLENSITPQLDSTFITTLSPTAVQPEARQSLSLSDLLCPPLKRRDCFKATRPSSTSEVLSVSAAIRCQLALRKLSGVLCLWMIMTPRMLQSCLQEAQACFPVERINPTLPPWPLATSHVSPLPQQRAQGTSPQSRELVTMASLSRWPSWSPCSQVSAGKESSDPRNADTLIFCLFHVRGRKSLSYLSKDGKGKPVRQRRGGPSLNNRKVSNGSRQPASLALCWVLS